MKKILKSIVKNTIGVQRVMWVYELRNWIVNYRNLIVNFLIDFNLYYRYSNVFKIDNLSKIESKIILDYHSVEKGLLFTNIRLGFAEKQNY